MKRILKHSAAGVLALALSSALIVAVAVATLGVAHAQADSISIGNAQLVNRVVVNMPVTITCTIPPGSTLNFSEQDGASVSQAVGRTVTTSQFNGFQPFFSIGTCDGTAHTLIAVLTPSPGSLAYHGGPAVASAFFFVSFTAPDGTSGSVGASANNVPIRISG